VEQFRGSEGMVVDFREVWTNHSSRITIHFIKHHITGFIARGKRKLYVCVYVLSRDIVSAGVAGKWRSRGSVAELHCCC